MFIAPSFFAKHGDHWIQDHCAKKFFITGNVKSDKAKSMERVPTSSAAKKRFAARLRKMRLMLLGLLSCC